MSDREQAAAYAVQADYFKRYLKLERSESAERLSALNRRLNECVTTGQASPVNYLCGIVRTAEEELDGIDRMLDALKGRFPEGDDVRCRP